MPHETGRASPELRGQLNRSAVSAFTLVELVTVIVILSILAVGVGGPTLAHLTDLRARAAAGRIAADLRFAQRMALASGQRTWVHFDVAANSYQIYIEDVDNPGKAGRLLMVRPLEQSAEAIQLNVGALHNVFLSSVDFNGGNEVEFDSFGMPYDASSEALTLIGTVQLTNGAAVEVHPIGGFVERS